MSGPDVTSRREIDMALGVLMTLRRCSERQAFDELVAAVHATGVGPAGIGAALLAVVSGALHGPHAAAAAARWGHLVAVHSAPAAVAATPGD